VLRGPRRHKPSASPTVRIASKFETSDRPEVAALGLTLWLSGVVASPLVHAVLIHGSGAVDPEYPDAWLDHCEAAPHSHPLPGDPHHGSGHSHSNGNLEHLGACCLSPVGAPTAPLPFQFFEESSALRPILSPIRRNWSPEMPQAP
jgi:hypothetical protein